MWMSKSIGFFFSTGVNLSGLMGWLLNISFIRKTPLTVGVSSLCSSQRENVFQWRSKHIESDEFFCSRQRAFGILNVWKFIFFTHYWQLNRFFDFTASRFGILPIRCIIYWLRNYSRKKTSTGLYWINRPTFTFPKTNTASENRPSQRGK